MIFVFGEIIDNGMHLNHQGSRSTVVVYRGSLV